MRVRFARHSKDIKVLTKFYIDILGMAVLGSFQDHDDYNGVFLGYRDKDWHLEFTESNDDPSASYNDDDAIVFYLESRA